MKFSCLISCYRKDNPLFLAEALQSIEHQEAKPDEIVFVEDGELSSPLYDVLDEFTNILPIKRVRIKENKGLGNALNHGLLACSYDIVMRMDTDDICHPERFRKQLDFLIQNTDISIVGTWAKDIDNDGKIIGERTYPSAHTDLYKIIWSCPFAHPTVAFRRADILKVGSYRTDIKRRQDYDLWMRAAAGGLKFGNIPEFLLYYRFTDDYYKKNNLRVAWSQSMMGVRGLRALKTGHTYPYLAVFTPVVRAILPGFIEKPVHRLLRKIDPRSRYVIK